MDVLFLSVWKGDVISDVFFSFQFSSFLKFNLTLKLLLLSQKEIVKILQ